MHGRYGDTTKRMVDGEPAHVNPVEAHWIDNYGPLGEMATMASGSGTTNPYTGDKEYFWPQVGALALQFGGPLLSAHLNKDQSNLDSNMQSYTDTINAQKNIAMGTINPDSALNKLEQDKIRNNALDAMSVQNTLSNRNRAMGGIGAGNYSGIFNQQQTDNMARMNRDVMNTINQNRLNNRTLGFNMLNTVGSGQRYMGEAQTQRDLSMMSPDFGQMAGAFGMGMFDNLFDEYGFGSPFAQTTVDSGAVQ